MAHGHSPLMAYKVRRQKVWQAVPCPQCGAPAGQRCIRVNGGERYASHAARWDASRTAG